MYRMKKGKCSFCRKYKPTVKKMGKAESQICDECVYLCNVHIGKYSKGLLVCPACNSWDLFTFYAAEGGSIKFICRGLDSSNDEKPEPPEVIYVPVTSSERIRNQVRELRAIECGNCKHPVPAWLSNHNSYIQQHFRVKQHGTKKT